MTDTAIRRIEKLERCNRAWRTAALAGAVCLAMSSVIADAELDDDLSAEFQAGDPILAEEMNNGFNALYAAVNALEEGASPRSCGFTSIGGGGNVLGCWHARHGVAHEPR